MLRGVRTPTVGPGLTVGLSAFRQPENGRVAVGARRTRRTSGSLLDWRFITLKELGKKEATHSPGEGIDQQAVAGAIRPAQFPKVVHQRPAVSMGWHQRPAQTLHETVRLQGRLFFIERIRHILDLLLPTCSVWRKGIHCFKQL